MNISNYLNPHQINDAFQALVATTELKKVLEIQKKEIQQTIDRGWSGAVANNLIEPGKNAEVRNAQSREALPDEWTQMDETEMALVRNSETLAIARIEIDRMKLLVDYFRTVEV
jgi:hypothetical protein